MKLAELFDRLDLNRDGELSRSEIDEAARRMGWHWNEAPLLAVLDLFSVLRPVSRRDFMDYMHQIIDDPLGPFGKVLLNSPLFLCGRASGPNPGPRPSAASDRDSGDGRGRASLKRKPRQAPALLSKGVIGVDARDRYYEFLKNTDVETIDVPADEAAMLVIDPQRSFTRGVWMRSIGLDAAAQVVPIRAAFDNCARMLRQSLSRVETMFTRCPFPPCSYGWDEALADVVDKKQLYFIKPGNSVMFPPTNGFREWIRGFTGSGRKFLLIAGCTLNSCVRKSSIETQTYFKDRGLQVVVDLSLTGARADNYRPSSTYGGWSAVESAVREMVREGVRVAGEVRWV